MKWTGSPEPLSRTSELSGVYSVTVPVLSMDVALVPAVGGTVLVLEFCAWPTIASDALTHAIKRIVLIIIAFDEAAGQRAK